MNSSAEGLLEPLGGLLQLLLQRFDLPGNSHELPLGDDAGLRHFMSGAVGSSDDSADFFRCLGKSWFFSHGSLFSAKLGFSTVLGEFFLLGNSVAEKLGFAGQGSGSLMNLCRAAWIGLGGARRSPTRNRFPSAASLSRS
jgi:hypothetical protein